MLFVVIRGNCNHEILQFHADKKKTLLCDILTQQNTMTFGYLALTLLVILFVSVSQASFDIRTIHESTHQIGYHRPKIVLTSDHHSNLFKHKAKTNGHVSHPSGYPLHPDHTPNHPSITPFLQQATSGIPTTSIVLTNDQKSEFALKHNVTLAQVNALLALQDTTATKDLPFTVTATYTEAPIEFTIVLTPNIQLDLFVNRLKLVFGFPSCGNVFKASLDLTDWEGAISKVWSYELTIDLPRVCVSDFGISIPFTTLCIKLANVGVLQRGVVADVVTDIAVGVTALQYTEENLRLMRISVGQVDDCYTITNQETCIKSKANHTIPNSAPCGWCHATQQCLTARPDKKADQCKICNRCEFFLTKDEGAMKSECMKKSSCGWCATDKMCHTGDQLGPFDSRVKCDVVEKKESEKKTASIEYIQSLLGIQADDKSSSDNWRYNTVATVGKTTVRRAAVAGFFCIVFGVIFGFMVGVGTFTASWYYTNKKRSNQPTNASDLSTGFYVAHE
jgi:hypothetical protein